MFKKKISVITRKECCIMDGRSLLKLQLDRGGKPLPQTHKYLLTSGSLSNCHQWGSKGSWDTWSRTLHKAKHKYTGLYKEIGFRALKYHLFFSCSSFSILWDATYVEKRWQHLVRSLTNSTIASSLDMFPRAAHSLLQGRPPRVTSSS